MKKRFLKPIAAWAVATAFMFGCASTNEMSDNTGNTGQESTEVATGTTADGTDASADGTDVVVVETEVVSDTDAMTTDRESMANTETDIDYNDMFEDVANTEQYDVLALARMNPNLSTFVQLVELSGLAPSFEAAGPITLFAPTNEAFSELPQERRDFLMDPNNIGELIKVLNLHVLPSEVSSVRFNDSSFIDRGEEEDIPVTTEANGTAVYVGGAQIVKSDIEASNGVLHVVNGIIQTTEEAGADID